MKRRRKRRKRRRRQKRGQILSLYTLFFHYPILRSFDGIAISAVVFVAIAIVVIA